MQNWVDSDWQRYYSDGVYKCFRRRDGYQCCRLGSPAITGIFFLIIGGGILGLGIYLQSINDTNNLDLTTLINLLIVYACLALLDGLLHFYACFSFGFNAVRRFLLVRYGDALFYFLGGIIATIISIATFTYSTTGSGTGIVYSILSFLRGIYYFVILRLSIFGGGGLHHGNFCLCDDNFRHSV